MLLIATGNLAIALISYANPLLSAGANDRLEGRCPAGSAQHWTYDRSAWTPLAWTCTVTYLDGTKRTFEAF